MPTTHPDPALLLSSRAGGRRLGSAAFKLFSGNNGIALILLPGSLGLKIHLMQERLRSLTLWSCLCIFHSVFGSRGSVIVDGRALGVISVLIISNHFPISGLRAEPRRQTALPTCAPPAAAPAFLGRGLHAQF